MSHTVTTKGQVTIPKAIRKQLGLKPGSQVDFTLIDSSGVVLRRQGKNPREAEIRKRIQSIVGTATSGMTTEEIMLLTRGRKI